MKRTMFIIAACVLAAVSCQKEMAVENGTGSEGILTVTADIAQFGADTKTSIDGTATTIKPLWKEGDEIKLFATDGASAVYVLNAEDDGKASGTFTLKGGETALSGTFACAYYPAANATAYTDGTGITATIPDTQAYTANSFANGSFPMVGTGTLNAEKGNLDLTFKNVFGLVQLNFTGSETITKIDLVSKKTLNGTATIKADGSCSTKIANGNKQVSLSFETPVTLTNEATSFYIAVPADSTVSKVYVTTSTASPASTSLLYKENDITAARSQIKSLNSATLTSAGFTAVTYSEASTLTPLIIKGTVWAPVNCGYEPATTTPEYKGYPYGKQYQWGRKNGQGYDSSDPSYPSDASYPSREQIANNAFSGTNGTENSAYFYKGNSGGSATAVPYKCDWITTNGSNTFWNLNEGTASPVSKNTSFDPCPAGWRVPTYDELNALLGGSKKTISGNLQTDTRTDSPSYNMSGLFFDGTTTPKPTSGVFLSVAGSRNYMGGNGGGRGAYGYYWSSAVSGSKAWCLIVSSSAYMYTNYRANGFSVRCVQE